MNAPRARAAFLAALLLAGLAVVLSVVVARETSIGENEVAAADKDVAKGNWPAAIAHARSAAEALTPTSPWPERGLRRLESIGRDAAARGDESTARLAYASMRTAALETRSLGSDRSDWVARADEGLSRLAATAAGSAH